MDAPQPATNHHRNRAKFILAAIIVVGVLLRAAFYLEHSQWPESRWVDPSFGDQGFFIYWAQQMAAAVSGQSDVAIGEGSYGGQVQGQMMFRPPGYSMVMAAFFLLFKTPLVAIRIAQMLLGIINILLAYRLTRALFGVRAALCAAFVTSVFWLFVIHEMFFMHRIVKIFLILILLNSVFSWHKDKRLVSLLLIIATVTALWYTWWLGIFMFTYVFCFLTVTLVLARQCNQLWQPGVYAVSTLLLVTPLFMMSHHYSGTSMNRLGAFGYNFRAAAQDDNPLPYSLVRDEMVPLWTSPDIVRIVRYHTSAGEDEVDVIRFVNGHFLKAAVAWVMENPWKYLGDTLVRLIGFWLVPVEIPRNVPEEYYALNYWMLRGIRVPFAILTIISAMALSRIIGVRLSDHINRRKSESPEMTGKQDAFYLFLIGFGVLASAPYIICFWGTEYRLMLLPAMLPFVGLGLCNLADGLRSTRLWRRMAWLLMLVFLMSVTVASSVFVAHSQQVTLWGKAFLVPTLLHEHHVDEAEADVEYLLALDRVSPENKVATLMFIGLRLYRLHMVEEGAVMYRRAMQLFPDGFPDGMDKPEGLTNGEAEAVYATCIYLLFAENKEAMVRDHAIRFGANHDAGTPLI